MPPVSSMPNIDPHTMLHDLNFGTLDKVSKCIGSRWREFVSNLPSGIYKSEDVEEFAGSLQRNGTRPAYDVLLDLGYRGKTVKHLMSYLENMKLESALVYLKETEPLRINVQPESRSAKEDTTVTFRCEATGFPYPKYQWYWCWMDPTQSVSSTDGSNDEIHREELPHGCESELRLGDIKLKKHSGMYICEVYHMVDGKKANSLFSEQVYLDIVTDKGDPPVILKQPKSIEVEEGCPFTLSCKADGSPTLTYQWYMIQTTNANGMPSTEVLIKEGQEAKKSEPTYKQAIKGKDEGRYKCLVMNSFGSAESNIVTVQIVKKAKAQDAGITIQRHPQDVRQYPGKSVTLEIEASSIVELHYQWYREGEPVKGAVGPQLILEDLKPGPPARYHCEVSNDANFHLSSNKAKVEVLVAAGAVSENGQFFATDKVALLIGNQNYYGDTSLAAPEGDVTGLYYVLRNMGFKCITLSNLDLDEMKTAIRLFCGLLAKGAYGLFYFSGHGFECQGQVHLVPINASHGYSHSECISVDKVVRQMQERHTALNVILLDVCRKYNDNGRRTDRIEPIVRGNTIIGCASASNSEAFEKSYKPGYASHGIFSRKLIDRISSASPISEIIENVKSDVANHLKAGSKQFPVIQSDLNKPLSLRDPFAANPSQEVTQIRFQYLLQYHPFKQPNVVQLYLKEIDAHLKISFAADFTNILIVTVTAPAFAKNLIKEIQMTKVSQYIDVIKQRVRTSAIDQSDKEERITSEGWTWQIRNIQRLQEALTLEVITYFNDPYNAVNVQRVKTDGDILIQQLWKLYNQPREVYYPDSSTSSNFSLSMTDSCNGDSYTNVCHGTLQQ